MKKLFCIYCLALLFAPYAIAQNNSGNTIESINLLFETIKIEKSDSGRLALNDDITRHLLTFLRGEDSFNDMLDNVNYINKVSSSDKQLSIYSWAVPLSDTYVYNLVLQTVDDKVYSLTKISGEMQIDETRCYDSSQWYGSLYYEIIPLQYKKETPSYIALGWRKNGLKQQKIIDIISITDSGVIFGKDVLERKTYDDYFGRYDTEVKYRRVFEYDIRTSMFLGYNQRKKRVEFDNLSPMEVQDDKVLSMGADFSVNAYRIKRGRLLFCEDIKVKNKR